MEVPCYEGKQEVAFAAKNSLNILSGRRVIGQSETQHSCLNLPLTKCSEMLVPIRLSGWARLRQKNAIHPSNTNDFLTKYYLRMECFSMSLWQYFHYKYNHDNKDGKIYIPYAVGLQCTPTYPITGSYAKASLIKHKPWSKHNNIDFRSDEDAKQQFKTFISDDICPRLLKSEINRLETSHNNKHQKQPTNSNIYPETNNKKGSDSDDDDANDVVSAMNSFSRCITHSYDHFGCTFDKGLHHPWSK